MKNFLIISLLSLCAFACKENALEQQPEQCCASGQTCTQGHSQLNEGSEVSNLSMSISPYDFSSIVNFRHSVLIQADVEGLDKDGVVEAVHLLTAKLIDANMQTLEKCETEADADSAMLKLFMKTFAAKKLKDILEIN